MTSSKSLNLEKLRKIKLLILDVDGVLTDGSIYYADDGSKGKSFNVQDGLGIRHLMARGLEVAVISGGVSTAAENRVKYLGIKHWYIGVGEDKYPYFVQLKQTLQYSDEEIAYVGDDLPDLVVMQQVGFRVAVANAVQLVKESADYITQRSGGMGAVREVCDLLLAHSQVVR